MSRDVRATTIKTKRDKNWRDWNVSDMDSEKNENPNGSGLRIIIYNFIEEPCEHNKLLSKKLSN